MTKNIKGFILPLMETEQTTASKKRKPKMTAFDKAVDLLSRRGYAEKELYNALIKKNYDEQEASETIKQLLENRYLNDKNYAYERIRSRALLSKWGKRRIHTELKTRGVAEHLILEGFERFEAGSDERLNEAYNWQKEATELLQRKYGPWPTEINEAIEKAKNWEEKQEALKLQQKHQAKRINFLLRRGFTSEQALKAFEVNKSIF